jgi:hypothetical protein
MIYKVLGISICLSLVLVCTTIDTKALTFKKLPIIQTSTQWSVQVGEAEKGTDLVNFKEGEYSTYSLIIDKVGKDVSSVRINLYRNEPNSNTRYSLVNCPPSDPCGDEIDEQSIALAEYMNEGNPYLFSNILVAEKATEMEVEIVWTENSEGRLMKETFVFTNK